MINIRLRTSLLNVSVIRAEFLLTRWKSKIKLKISNKVKRLLIKLLELFVAIVAIIIMFWKINY